MGATGPKAQVCGSRTDITNAKYLSKMNTVHITQTSLSISRARCPNSNQSRLWNFRAFSKVITHLVNPQKASGAECFYLPVTTICFLIKHSVTNWKYAFVEMTRTLCSFWRGWSTLSILLSWSHLQRSEAELPFSSGVKQHCAANLGLLRL